MGHDGDAPASLSTAVPQQVISQSNTVCTCYCCARRRDTAAAAQAGSRETMRPVQVSERSSARPALEPARCVAGVFPARCASHGQSPDSLLAVPTPQAIPASPRHAAALAQAGHPPRTRPRTATTASGQAAVT